MKLKDQLDDTIYSYANLRQKEIIDAFYHCGSAAKAAKKLGISKQALHQSIKRAIHTAAKMGYSPAHDMTRTVADGYKVKGVSSYYNKDGELSGQWVKSTEDSERRATLVEEALKSAAESLPRLKPIPTKGEHLSNLINVYTITDYHIGMLAWSEEGGDDWDLKIAEKTLIQSFSDMIARSPRSETAIVNQMGDFMHFDGIVPVTPTSKHVLDADTRFRKMVRVAIRCMRAVIDMCLDHHKNVHVICAEGNHDLYGSHWLQELIINVYENEPRLTVQDTPKPYYCYQFGKTMICVTHGHLKKGVSLTGVFAAEFSKIWGNTTHRYAHWGHYHSREVIEGNGMIVERHPTLAARDSHASRGGYHAIRSCIAITYKKSGGEYSRVTIEPNTSNLKLVE